MKHVYSATLAEWHDKSLEDFARALGAFRSDEYYNIIAGVAPSYDPLEVIPESSLDSYKGLTAEQIAYKVSEENREKPHQSNDLVRILATQFCFSVSYYFFEPSPIYPKEEGLRIEWRKYYERRGSKIIETGQSLMLFSDSGSVGEFATLVYLFGNPNALMGRVTTQSLVPKESVKGAQISAEFAALITAQVEEGIRRHKDLFGCP